MDREYNNKDWLYAVADGRFEGLMVMLQSLDPQAIAMNCSPRHTQSVIEDLQKLALCLTLKLIQRGQDEIQ